MAAQVARSKHANAEAQYPPYCHQADEESVLRTRFLDGAAAIALIQTRVAAADAAQGGPSLTGGCLLIEFPRIHCLGSVKA